MPPRDEQHCFTCSDLHMLTNMDRCPYCNSGPYCETCLEKHVEDAHPDQRL